ncbi:MAG: hypothetical protein MR695_08835 [Solobacterium sp.]|nr:hypothetical protein [Solobacterium sp.]
MKSNTVRIQSSMTITVTSGLQCNDVTNKDAHIPDRLKVAPEWPKYSIQIMQGVGDYPAEIAKWNTVKALVEAGVMTISESTNEAKEEDVAKVESLNAKKEEKQGKRGKKGKTLDELVEEAEPVEIEEGE